MRFNYRDWVLGIDPHNLIFIDESGVNLGMTRNYGRAPRGERLYDSCPKNRGQNISLIGLEVPNPSCRSLSLIDVGFGPRTLIIASAELLLTEDYKLSDYFRRQALDRLHLKMRRIHPTPGMTGYVARATVLCGLSARITVKPLKVWKSRIRAVWQEKQQGS
jgi:hypothetical protein